MIFKFLKKIFFRKNKKEKQTPIIIPDHAKEKNEEKMKTEIKTEIKIEENKKDQKIIDLAKKNELKKKSFGLFKVTGVYNIGPTKMVTGFVEAGKLKKGMKSLISQTQIKIEEIRKGMEKSDFLQAGQEGTIVISSKKNPLILQGDFIDFE